MPSTDSENGEIIRQAPLDNVDGPHFPGPGVEKKPNKVMERGQPWGMPQGLK